MLRIPPMIYLGILTTVTAGCVSARIDVVGARTALENQILGSYEELDRDLQLLASVRGADDNHDNKPPNFTHLRNQAIRARQSQQFLRDDVDEMKQAGCLGEVHDGMLAARDCQLRKQLEVAKRIERLVESENQARRIILQFVVTTSPDLTIKDLPQVSAAFARMRREKVKSGEWFKNAAGSWIRIPGT